MFKRAVILAGGLGTRLRPYTVVFPKPLMPIGDSPILEVIIKQLAYFGFDHITLAVNHQAEFIQAFFRDGEKWGLKIDYSVEDKPLGTMGPLRIIHDLPDHFLVMNGDILTDLNFKDFYEKHVDKNKLFTISSHIRNELVDYGVLETYEGKLINIKEKPRVNYEVSMGIYMVSKDIVSLIPSDKPYGFDNLMLDLNAKNKDVSVKKHDGYWLDIGRPDDYEKAIDEFDKLKNVFIKNG